MKIQVEPGFAEREQPDQQSGARGDASDVPLPARAKVAHNQT